MLSLVEAAYTIFGFFVVNDQTQYDENTGLMLDNHWMNEILTI